MRHQWIRATTSVFLAALPLVVGLVALHAEVIDIDGTVVAVSVDDRTISIERQTAKGPKRVELEVARKAGDLQAVKIGERVSVSYDPALEIVTRLGSDGDSPQPNESADRAARSSIAKVSRVSVELTPRGGLTFRLEPGDDEQCEKPAGSSAPLSGLKGARVINDAGFYYIDVECDNKEAISVLGREGLDLRRGSLIADTSIGKDGIGQRAFIGIARQFRLPFTLQMDTARQGMARRQAPSHGDCSLNFNFGISTTDGQEVGHVFVTVQPLDPLFNTGKVFFELREPNKELKRVAERDIHDGKAEYRLQVPGVSSESKLSWWCVVRGEPAQIERVRAAGPIMPSVGVRLEGKAGQVVVRQVLEDSPAGQAGITDEDVLLSVNGERVRDAETAVALFSRANIGDEITLEVKRGEKARKVAVRAN